MEGQSAKDLGRVFYEQAMLDSFILEKTKLVVGPMKDIIGFLRTIYALITLKEDILLLITPKLLGKWWKPLCNH